MLVGWRGVLMGSSAAIAVSGEFVGRKEEGMVAMIVSFVPSPLDLESSHSKRSIAPSSPTHPIYSYRTHLHSASRVETARRHLYILPRCSPQRGESRCGFALASCGVREKNLPAWRCFRGR